jgi:hypothetical protein
MTEYRGTLQDEIVDALDDLVNATALADIRGLVSGWNGENRPEGPYKDKHPARLGVTLKTCAAHIYALDDAMVRARALLAELAAPMPLTTDLEPCLDINS